MLLKYIRENFLARFFLIIIFILGLAIKIFLTGEEVFSSLSIQTAFASIQFSGDNLLLNKGIIYVLLIAHATLGAFVLKHNGLIRRFSLAFSILLGLSLAVPLDKNTFISLCMAILTICAIAILWSINIKKDTVAKYYNASFLIGILVYSFPAACFLLLGIIFACPILKLNKIKEILGGVAGIFTAFLLIYLLNFVSTKEISWNPIPYFGNLRAFPAFSFELSYLLFVLSIGVCYRVFSDKRKYSLSLDSTVPAKLNILFLFYFIALPLFFLFETRVLFIFPAASLFTLYFFKQKETLSKESLFYILLVLFCFLIFQ